jgi:hypothetical protein
VIPSRFALAAAAALLLAGPALAETPRLILEFEAGAAWQTVNDVQVPNDASGTRFSLVDVAGKGPWFAGRTYVTYNFNDRHGLRGLFAPLSITETAELDGPVDFAGGSFAPGVPTEANYKFNSYRLSYRYQWKDGERWSWWVGFTAKIRDARIRLVQDGVAAEKTDVGFVPLLHLAATCRLNPCWTFELDLDALAGGPGRAEDLSLKLRRHMAGDWSAAVGYRMVEGGADVESVYAFAWLHYAVASVGLTF